MINCRKYIFFIIQLFFTRYPSVSALLFYTQSKSTKQTFMKARLRKRIVSFSMQMLALCGAVQSHAQTTATGPSTLQTPFVQPLLPGYKFTSILSANDSIGGYPMAGTPDGLGAFDNGDGTFTLLMNHEFVNTVGAVRAHGSKGAFVSKWVIKKSDLSVQSGSDLTQNVNLWNGTGYTTYNASSPMVSGFSRFCSADLPAVSAFYNSASGLGTQERIFMNGEESGTEGRAFAHIATGTNAGTTYELPYLGKFAWENSVASPATGDKTVVGGMDDGTGGQVYFYVGTKTNSGTEIEKAGLSNGKLFGIAVTGFTLERVNSTTLNPLPAAGTRFSMVDFGDVSNVTGATLNTNSVNAGATSFSRPEDGAWDPSHPNDFYFATTDQIDQVNDGVGTQVGRTRLWRLRFDDVNSPELGGTIEAVLDGTEGPNMMDNLGIDKYGHITLQEDVGNSAHNGKIWQYDIATDALKMIGKHDAARFGDIGVAATAPYNQDEESSGVIDVQDILGAGMYLIVDQAHSATGIPTDLVENGQLLAMYNCPASYSSDTVTACGSYAWNGQTYSTSGTYTFTTTNAAGCDSTATLVLTVNDAPVASAVTTPVVCFGGFSTATINVTGGLAPYQYQLNNRNPQSSNVFADLKARTYQVIVTDAKGCSDTISFTITQPARPGFVLVSVTKPSCQGASDGTVIVTGTGGTAPYLYSLNDGPFTSSGIYGVFNGLSAGTYKLSLKDANNCIFSVSRSFPDGNGTCANAIASSGKQSSDSKLKATALNVKVLPNPSSANFTLIAESNSTDQVQIIVSDVYGKNVFTTKGSVGKAYTFGDNLNTGVYFVKVIQGKNFKTIKLIKD
jgi:SprB repeat/Secretion system C-terminal sorting domain/Bacterial protein of unknown function (DUF839)